MFSRMILNQLNLLTSLNIKKQHFWKPFLLMRDNIYFVFLQQFALTDLFFGYKQLTIIRKYFIFDNNLNTPRLSLREKSKYGVFSGPYFLVPVFPVFWSVFSCIYCVNPRIQSEYRPENTDQKKLRIWTLHAVYVILDLAFTSVFHHYLMIL